LVPVVRPQVNVAAVAAAPLQYESREDVNVPSWAPMPVTQLANNAAPPAPLPAGQPDRVLLEWQSNGANPAVTAVPAVASLPAMPQNLPPSVAPEVSAAPGAPRSSVYDARTPGRNSVWR